MARRRAPSQSNAVEINVTSFLDVIFNILAFFVVTYSPPLPEKNFDVTLPPPKQTEAQAASTDLPDIEPVLYQDVTITLTAGAAGGLAGIKLQEKVIAGGVGRLSSELQLMVGAIGGATGERIETATIVSAGNLKYRWLIAVVDACYQANIRRINFAEPAAAAPAAP